MDNYVQSNIPRESIIENGIDTGLYNIWEAKS
jgi:hypothetical protein